MSFHYECRIAKQGSVTFSSLQQHSTIVTPEQPTIFNNLQNPSTVSLVQHQDTGGLHERHWQTPGAPHPQTIGKM